MSDWIDIENERPKIGDRVIICTTNGNVIEAIMYDDRKFNRFGLDVVATDWQPMPEKPRKR